MGTYKIVIDERTREGKAIRRYILKAGAVKISDEVGLNGLCYDYRKRLERAIKAAAKDKKKYVVNSIEELIKMGL